MKTSVRKNIAQTWAKLAGLAALCATAAQAQFVSTVVTNLNSPSAVASDPAGNVYITDSGDDTIVKFVPTSGSSSALAGATGVAGAVDGFGSLARFNNPVGIAYDSALNGLIVVDQGNDELRLVTLGGWVSTISLSPGTFLFPTAVAIDSSGANIFVADSGHNQIQRVTVSITPTATNYNVAALQIGNGYAFKYPEGISLDGNNNLWVADKKNDVIVVISNALAGGSLSATVVAGAKGQAGSTDDPFDATNARFTLPSDVHWDGALGAALVADTGDNTIREIYTTNGPAGTAWAVQTLAGIAGTAGLVNGTPAAAVFNQPAQLAVDAFDSGLYIVDEGNGVVRAFQPSAPEPQVGAPTFGIVTFPLVGTPPTPSSLFTASSNAVLVNYDPPRIAIKADPGTETYITYGPTPADPLNSAIPAPGPSNGLTPEIYTTDGLSEDASPPTIVPALPDMTIYAVSYGPGRQPSPVVSARFQLVTANPVIQGLNPAAITLIDATTNSVMFYTTNGTDPDNLGSNTSSLGPIVSGQVLSFNINGSVPLRVRAFHDGFADSGISTETLSESNVVYNELTFGFPTGEEGSSEFMGMAGQRFVAPVTLTLLPGATMYSLQFNATVGTVGSAPDPGYGGYLYTFQSMLKKPDPTNRFLLLPITNSVFADLTDNLLGVGWLERAEETNLYPTTSQDLIATSLAKDDVFSASEGKVIVGAYSFVVPANAQLGQQYQIQLARPSATADGIGVIAAPISAPTNGSPGVGSISALKDVTIVQGGLLAGQLSYLVGDVNNFRWFNVGDFGDGNLDNSDVEEVFQSAVYGLNTPAYGSDMFDAMDSANSDSPSIFTGDDATANALMDNMLQGDHVLDIADVYVTFRRSLDPALLWVRRYYGPGGFLQAVNVPNNPSPASIRAVAAPAVPPAPVKSGISAPHTITIGIDQMVASTSTVVLPVRVLAADPNGLAIRDMMFDLQVQALDGSPALTEPVVFTPDSSLGQPAYAMSKGLGDFAGAWLSTNTTGFAGTGIIGTVTFSLPAGVNTNSAYLVSLLNFSASPNGLGVYTATVQNGLVTLSDRSASSWGDGISDAWRLLHFGTISSPASAATADPDGDGASNWQEYIAGTDPLNAASVFKLQAGSAASSGFSLQWPSVVGKSYTVQSASSPNASSWTTVTTVSGTGATMSWSDTSGSTQAKFYRAAVQ